MNFAKILRKPFLQNTSEGETASALNKMFYLGCSSFTFEHFSDNLLGKKNVDSIFCFPRSNLKICRTSPVEAISETIFHRFSELTSKIFQEK